MKLSTKYALTLCLVFCGLSPFAVFAEAPTDVSVSGVPRTVSPADIMEYILKSTLLSATTTQISSIDMDTTFASTTPLQSIETSTTTLSIDAPMLKLWQDSGGIRTTQSSGTHNKEVLLVQGALKAFVPEFKNTYISGYYGQKTVEGVKLLQKKWGLPDTGIIGKKTRTMLNEKYLEDLCPSRDSIDRSYEHVDRDTALPLDYVPPALRALQAPVVTTGIICLSHEPARRLGLLFTAAKKAGIHLIVFSGYRRAEIQLLLASWSSHNALSTSTRDLLGLAEVGHSEHQLGTTVDLAGTSVGYIGPTQKFGTSREGKWLAANAFKYGFVMSYPQGKESVTGYIYEPWHYRYIGVDNAQDIANEHMTLKEYFDLINSTATSSTF